MTHPTDPQNAQEWQAAANRADMCLLLRATPLDIEVDVPRCEEVVARAREHGVHPNWTQIELHRLISAHLEARRKARGHGAPLEGTHP